MEQFGITTIKLPALHFGTSCRVVNSEPELTLMRGNALSPPKKGMVVVPQFYWDADDIWYQAVGIRKIRKAPWLMRFQGADDLMVAEFSLMRLPERPDDWDDFCKFLRGILKVRAFKNPEKVKQGLREFDSAIQSSRLLVEWFEKYIGPQRPGHGY